MHSQRLPQKIRVSIGSAILLGLTEGRMDVQPTTLYLLTHYRGKCTANCGFCAQSQTSTSRADMLSRITWPLFPVETVINQIKVVEERNLVERVCIQTMNYLGAFREVLALINKINSMSILPISISCQPLSNEQILQLMNIGVDRIGTPELFQYLEGNV